MLNSTIAKAYVQNSFFPSRLLNFDAFFRVRIVSKLNVITKLEQQIKLLVVPTGKEGFVFRLISTRPSFAATVSMTRQLLLIHKDSRIDRTNPPNCTIRRRNSFVGVF